MTRNGAESRTIQRAGIFIVGILFLVLLAQAMVKVDRASGNDLTSYLLSAKALVKGGNPYKTSSPFPYVYPLFLAFVLIPLSFLAKTPASLIWFALNACAFAYSYKALIDTFSQEWGDRVKKIFWPLLSILSVLTFDILQNHFLNGQVNLIVLSFMILFFTHDKKNNNFVASIFLSLAISIKIVPLVLLIYLVSEKKFKSIAYTLLLTVFWILAPATIAGTSIISYYQGYFQQFILNHAGSVEKINASHVEFSLQYFMNKMTCGVVPRPCLLLISILLALLPIIVLDRMFCNEKRSETRMWIFSLYLIAILLLSPMSETHHLVFFLPALVLNLVTVSLGTNRRPFRQLMLLAATFSFLIVGGFCRSNTLYFLALCTGYFMTMLFYREHCRKRERMEGESEGLF